MHDLPGWIQTQSKLAIVSTNHLHSPSAASFTVVFNGWIMH
jgi:hypothetical protein